jgi:Cdc6-like AAA superfamily ATPase
MLKAFITYSHQDNSFVDRLVGDLEMKTELNIAIDKRVLGAGDSLIKIFGEIETSDFLIPVLSTNSVNSNWCKKELRVAIVKEIEESAFKVIPVVKEREKWESLQAQIPGDLRGALKDKLMARFDSKEYREAFKDLIRNVTPPKSSEDVYDQIEDPTGENPFRRVRAEHFADPEVFARLFTEPVHDHDKLMSPKPAFLEGGRGTGKTMILKSLQAQLAVLRKNALSFSAAQLHYFGVYCRMTRESFATVSSTVLSSIGEHSAMTIYSDELVLKLVQSVIDEIKSCVDENFIELTASVERQLAKNASHCLRLNPQQVTDLTEINALINEQLDLINDYIDSRGRTEAAEYRVRSLKRRHLERFCKAVQQNIRELRNCTIVFLVDEYENLAKFQKVVLNTLIKWHTAGTWTFKVAVKKTGFDTAKTLEGQELEEGPDYSRVDLDFDTLDPSRAPYQRYVSYVKSICIKILASEGFLRESTIENILEQRNLSHDALSDDKIVAEIKTMLAKRSVQWEKLNAKEQRQHQNHYAVAAYYRLLKRASKKRKFGGFTDFVLLSSGIVRTFLELCGLSYYFAREEGIGVKNGEKITVLNQTEAAYALSEHYIWKISKDVEELGPMIRGLVVDLGDVFRQKLTGHLSEPEAARMVIADPSRLEASMITVKTEREDQNLRLKHVLDIAVMHSILHEYESRGGRRPRHPYDEPPYDYLLNRIFAPSLDFSVRARWATKIGAEELRNLLDPNKRVQTKQGLLRRVTTESDETGLFTRLIT